MGQIDLAAGVRDRGCVDRSPALAYWLRGPESGAWSDGIGDRRAMIDTVVVGYGLAGRAFHCPLVRRQPGLRLAGVVARDPAVRAEAEAQWGVRGLCVAGRRPGRPRGPPGRDRHAARLPRRAGRAGARGGQGLRRRQGHGPDTAEADRMIAARDASGRLLSVFHNRRWDWDFVTAQGRPGAGPDRPPAGLRQLGLPLRGAADLAGAGGGGGDDPARLGCAPDRPGPAAGSWTLPAALRLGRARPLAGRR